METHPPLLRRIIPDLVAGLVVFLVALPLCLGIAFASNAPPFSGLLAGIVGGLVVGLLSGSHTSVSGPAAGLTAVVATQIHDLKTFETFLLALLIAGFLQIAISLARLGFIAKFFPSSVIRGLLAAIGVILILKQFPHVLGHDKDPEGEMAFVQPDHETTFSEMADLLGDFHPGAAFVGVLSVLLLVAWDRIKALKYSPIPAPLVVVVLGVALATWFHGWSQDWQISGSHLVQVPVAGSLQEFWSFMRLPDFSQWSNWSVYQAAVVIALVASLETLLNLEAVDQIDPLRRQSPPSRELFAQGVGNSLVALLGGIPLTSVIVRSSVNIHSGAKTKLSAILHGVLLLVCAALIPGLLNCIPLSCLAAILLVTGIKLAPPSLLWYMWREGWVQFLPFVVTVVAIVFTDLLVGILVGLGVSIAFILNSNVRRPIQMVKEKHVGGDFTRVELAAQVSFLNKAALSDMLESLPVGTRVVLDARTTVFIDPDILSLIEDFQKTTARTRNIDVGLVGFEGRFRLHDVVLDADTVDSKRQELMSPGEVIELLKAGNVRFRTGHRLKRDLEHQVRSTSEGQFPMAAILTCIDSRSPSELVFDLGLGDIFSIRVAGEVVREKVLGSLEYACAVAGTKVIVIMGHTNCGAIGVAVNSYHQGKKASEMTGCENLDILISDIQTSIDDRPYPSEPEARARYVDEIATRHVIRLLNVIRTKSQVLDKMAHELRIAIVGCMYDVRTGLVTFLNDPEVPADRV